MSKSYGRFKALKQFLISEYAERMARARSCAPMVAVNTAIAMAVCLSASTIFAVKNKTTEYLPWELAGIVSGQVVLAIQLIFPDHRFLAWFKSDRKAKETSQADTERLDWMLAEINSEPGGMCFSAGWTRSDIDARMKRRSLQEQI